MSKMKIAREFKRPSGKDPFTRQEPHSPDTERTVLAAVLHDGKNFRLIQGILHPSHFYEAFHRDVYLAFDDLMFRGEIITEETVSVWLINEGVLKHPDGEEVRGVHPQIIKLKSCIHNAEFDITGHAKRLKRWAAMRELIQALKIALDECYETDSPSAVITEHVKAVSKIDTTETDHLTHISAPLEQFWADLSAPKEKKILTVIRTGFQNLDDVTGGISRGTVSVVVARSKVGKSTICSQFLSYESEHTDNASIYFLLEMDNALLIRRMVQQITGLPIRKFISGELDPSRQQLQEIEQAVATLRDYNIFLVDKECDSVPKMRQYLYSFRAKYPNKQIGWIVADHWNLFEGNSNNDIQEKNAKAFNDLIKEFNARGLLPAQCKKAAPGKEKEIPSVEEVRGSNALLEIASNMFVLHRPNMGTGETGAIENCEIHFAAGREEGFGAKIPLRFNPLRIEFTEDAHTIGRQARLDY